MICGVCRDRVFRCTELAFCKGLGPINNLKSCSSHDGKEQPLQQGGDCSGHFGLMLVVGVLSGLHRTLDQPERLLWSRQR